MPFDIDALPQVALPGLNVLHAEEGVMINELARLAAAGEGAAFDGLLAEFAEHFDQHLELEKQNMLRTSYPEREAHIAEHDAMLARFAELRAGAPGLEVWHAFFDTELPAWFLPHVAEHDTPTAAFIAANA